MPREYAVRDIKELRNLHQRLLQELHDTAFLSYKIKTETIEIAKNGVKAGVFDIRLQHELIDGFEETPLSPSETALLRNLFLYRETKQFCDQGKQILAFYEDKIRTNMAVAEEGTKGLKWLFLSNEKKKAINDAVLALQQILGTEYPKNVQNLSETIQKIQNCSNEKALYTVLNNKEGYRDIFQQVFTNAVQIEEPAQIIRGLFSDYNYFTEKVSSAEYMLSAMKQPIIDGVVKLAGRESLNILKEIPVEEINRDKNGIKVKVLKEYGYNNIADLYTATTYQLASIHGISEDAAFQIKYLVDKMAENAQQNTKIKLSADNRTKEATNLVSLVYAYKQKRGALDEVKHIQEEHAQENSRQVGVLKGIGNGVEWLLLPDEKKTDAKHSFTNLSNLTKGIYKDCISRLDASFAVRIISDDTAWADFQKDAASYFTIIEQIAPGYLGNNDSLYGLPEELAREIQEEEYFPDGLRCSLRRYQEWGVKYILHQEKVLLGDEMGLGKTVQAIATMVSLRNTGATHFMVVCPASVLTNWCREITKHSKLRAMKIHGSGRLSAMRSWYKTGGVGVTTYETTSIFSQLEDYSFELLVVDEAHYVKNPSAQRTVNVKEIANHANRLLFMTGTALENKVDEMVSLIDILQPEIAEKASAISFMSQAEQFRLCVAPVYYRRQREDVLTELPELIDTKEWCTMTPEETEIYENNIMSRSPMAARQVSWNIPDLSKSSKAKRLLEIIEEAREEERKVIVFSFFLNTIRAIGDMLGSKAVGVINGAVPVPRRQEIIDDFDSAKAGSVLLAQIQSGGTGLNIQSASVVIICEPQIKPSIENQAISRAYRMGQSRNVLVYHLLCEDSIDERMVDMLEEKQAIFDAFADKSVAAEESISIDSKTMGNIIQAEIDRINRQSTTSANNDVEVAADVSDAENITESSEIPEMKEPPEQYTQSEQPLAKTVEESLLELPLDESNVDYDLSDNLAESSNQLIEMTVEEPEEILQSTKGSQTATVKAIQTASNAAVSSDHVTKANETTAQKYSGLAEYVEAHILCSNCQHAMTLAKGRTGKTFLRCSSCKNTELLDYHVVNQYIKENHIVCPEHGNLLKAGVSRYGLYVRCNKGHFIPPEKI